MKIPWLLSQWKLINSMPWLKKYCWRGLSRRHLIHLKKSFWVRWEEFLRGYRACREYRFVLIIIWSIIYPWPQWIWFMKAWILPWVTKSRVIRERYFWNSSKRSLRIFKRDIYFLKGKRKEIKIKIWLKARWIKNMLIYLRLKYQKQLKL